MYSVTLTLVEVLDMQFWHFLCVCTCEMFVCANVFCHRPLRDLYSFY